MIAFLFCFVLPYMHYVLEMQNARAGGGHLPHGDLRGLRGGPARVQELPFLRAGKPL